MNSALARFIAVAVTAIATMLALGGPANAGDGGEGSHRDQRGGRAPLVRAEPGTTIPGQYIVVMEPGAGAAAIDRAASQASARGARVLQTYDTALTGFAARMPAQAVEALRDHPAVAFIEEDSEVTVQGTQRKPPWGLDRIDQRKRALNRRYRYDSDGSGVTAYVIDTGLRKAHREVRGRVAAGFTSVSDGRGTGDCNGHGTHVAATLGGTTYGVAKAVTIRPVRVLGCNGAGSTSRVIAGVDWVTEHHVGAQPAVANMSIGGGVSMAVDAAVGRSIVDGITYVVAAGNESSNACQSSPARLGSALTVGSVTKKDRRSFFSNFGRCVDLFAPGSAITSAWHTGNRASRQLSGTSMAAPHVAGAAALYLDRYPTATPAMLAEALLSRSTEGRVAAAGSGSPNRLLFSRVGVAPAAPSGNHLVNPGFEAGPVGWSSSPEVITPDALVPARSGSWNAWLGGWGFTHTDHVQQTLSIPAGSSAELSFYLRVETDESPGAINDLLDVEIQSDGTWTWLRGFSDAHAGSTYVRRSIDLSDYAGKRVTVRFSSIEDSSAPTSFYLDDVMLTTS